MAEDDNYVAFPLINGFLSLINNLPDDLKIEIKMKECVIPSDNLAYLQPPIESKCPQSPAIEEEKACNISLECSQHQDRRCPSLIQDHNDTAKPKVKSVPQNECKNLFNSLNPEENCIQSDYFPALMMYSGAQSSVTYFDHLLLDSSLSENHSGLPSATELNWQNAFNQKLPRILYSNCPPTQWRPTTTDAPNYNISNFNQQMINEVTILDDNHVAINTLSKKRRRGRPALIESNLEKLPEPNQTRAIFRKILTMLKESKVNSIKGRCQNLKINGMSFQEALAIRQGLDKDGYKRFAQKFKLVSCPKQGEGKPIFQDEECSIIWDVCYRFSTQAMNAFARNNILRAIFDTAYEYLKVVNHESRINRAHQNKGRVITAQQMDEYHDGQQKLYLNTLNELYDYYARIVNQN
ncbi:hypothetical protein FGO68_gene4214 [Halteria grandinella]|uniref:Uncharacterized protein n=1 Tax=Halteria grandinella TaxID=5974 RepID=A0A8J8NQQ9_HALGN|nr:hypothetical protein FGO68_gene4214 [Halteria grandinella]